MLGDCELWAGPIRRDGYGQLRHRGKVVKAHRVAYEKAYGPIPAGMCVCHKCDNPACVRVSHLFLGTHADNVADKVGKGRQYCPTGELHGRAKLTEAAVLAMRAKALSGSSRTELSREYGVTEQHVGYVLSRKSWKHI